MHLLNIIMKWWKVTLFYWGTIKHVDRLYIYNCGMTLLIVIVHLVLALSVAYFFLMYSVLSLL